MKYGAILVLASALAILSACDTGGSSSKAQSQEQNSSVGVEDRQELVRGNIIEPSSLDPHKLGSSNEVIILRDLFEGLLVTTPNGTIAPGVASAWASDDLQHYTFHLRPDARWSNGDPVTAQDFAYGWRRAIDPESASTCAGDFANARLVNAEAVTAGRKLPSSLGVTALDARTLQVTLDKPLAYFVDMVATYSCFYPLHQPTIEKHGKHWTRTEHYVSNGPFVLTEWKVNESVVLRRNPHYWDRDSVRLDQATYLPIGSLNAELARYRSGEVDITFSVPDEQLPRLFAQLPGQLRIMTRRVTFGFDINGGKPPFNDPELRKALAYALDREKMTTKLFNRDLSPAYSHTPDNIPQFPQPTLPWARMTQSERETKAQHLYREAGFSKENPLKIRLIYFKSEIPRKIGLAAAAMWKKVLGIEVQQEALENKSLVARLQEGNFDLVFYGHSTSFAEPSPILNLRRTGNSKEYGYSNPAYDAILESASATADTTMRAQLYARAEAILAEDMPFIPLLQPVGANLVKPHVRGYPEIVSDSPPSKILWVEREQQENR